MGFMTMNIPFYAVLEAVREAMSRESPETTSVLRNPTRCLGQTSFGHQLNQTVGSSPPYQNGLGSSKAPWLEVEEVAFVSAVFGECQHLLVLEEYDQVDSVVNDDGTLTLYVPLKAKDMFSRFVGDVWAQDADTLP